MSNREYEITQTIANLATAISSRTGLPIEESMNLVYNSENWNIILGYGENGTDYGTLESAMMKELLLG